MGVRVGGSFHLTWEEGRESGGKGGRELSSHPIVIDVDNGDEICVKAPARRPARHGGEGAGPISEPQL